MPRRSSASTAAPTSPAGRPTSLTARMPGGSERVRVAQVEVVARDELEHVAGRVAEVRRVGVPEGERDDRRALVPQHLDAALQPRDRVVEPVGRDGEGDVVHARPRPGHGAEGEAGGSGAHGEPALVGREQRQAEPAGVERAQGRQGVRRQGHGAEAHCAKGRASVAHQTKGDRASRCRRGVPAAQPVMKAVSRPRAERGMSGALVERSEATAGGRRERSAAAVVCCGAVIDGGGVAVERATKEGAPWPPERRAADPHVAG